MIGSKPLTISPVLGMILFGNRTEIREPDWSKITNLAIEPQRDLSEDQDGTEFAICKDNDAEIWAVFAMIDGDWDLITDAKSRIEAEAIVTIFWSLLETIQDLKEACVGMAHT